MKQNDFNEFNTINQFEHNKSPDEINVIKIVNEYQIQSNEEIDNNFNQIKKTRKKNNLFKLIASFMVVCAVAAIIQTVFPIPIFSRLFSPALVTTTTYSFNSVVTTDELIIFSLSLKNVDLKKDNYSLCLVEQNNATEEYIQSISDNIKSDGQIKIKNLESTHNFTTYITSGGSKKINSNTVYTIVLLRNEKIVQTYNVTTKQKIYFSEVNVSIYGGNINVTMKADASFTDFVILIRVTNLSDPTWGPEGNGVDQTTCNDTSLPGSNFAFHVVKGLYAQSYDVKIYCRTTDPEKKTLPDTVTHGDIENPEYYYLIYAYDKPIIY